MSSNKLNVIGGSLSKKINLNSLNFNFNLIIPLPSFLIYKNANGVFYVNYDQLSGGSNLKPQTIDVEFLLGESNNSINLLNYGFRELLSKLCDSGYFVCL